MKYKNLSVILAVASLSFSAINGVAQAEKIGNLPSAAPAVETAKAATPSGNELQMFRFALEMDKEAFVKKSMKLDAAQEKKFMDVYYVFNAKLVALNNKRLAVIADYVSNIEKMTDAKAGELAKRTIEFRKKRVALDAAYYAAVAKATTKTIAVRALQVENILQGAGDVVIGSNLPLMPE
jgi:5'-3' exonuclease